MYKHFYDSMLFAHQNNWADLLQRGQLPPAMRIPLAGLAGSLSRYDAAADRDEVFRRLKELGWD
jgi:hypothetical protein